jgi:arsenate reductase
MAEGLVNSDLAETWMARSAGTRPAPVVHPMAIRAMSEIDIDISTHVPENVDIYVDEPWDLVVTVCDSAKESCPVFPGRVETLHISFQDPAEAEGSDAEVMAVFRSVRDRIRGRLVPQIQARSN